MQNGHGNGTFNGRMYACGKYRFWDYRRPPIKSGAKYRCEYIPLFSLAPSCSCALITQIRKRGVRACVLPLTGGDHIGVRKYRAHGPTGNATRIHDCIAGVMLVFRLHAVCLSVTSVSLRLYGHLVLFMVYQLSRSVVRSEQNLVINVHV